jgi:hypothetical protein
VKKKKGELRINPEKSLQREKKNYTWGANEREGASSSWYGRAVKPPSTLYSSFFFFLLLFGLKVILYVQTLFFYMRVNFHCFFFFSFSFEQIKRPALCIHTHTIFDGHHSSFNLAKICFVLRF